MPSIPVRCCRTKENQASFSLCACTVSASWCGRMLIEQRRRQFRSMQPLLQPINDQAEWRDQSCEQSDSHLSPQTYKKLGEGQINGEGCRSSFCPANFCIVLITILPCLLISFCTSCEQLCHGSSHGMSKHIHIAA